MVAAGDFLEHARVFDNYYGTSRRQVEQLLDEGQDVLLEIDWQGAQQIRRTLPECRTIFVLPPSRAALEQRLRGRGTDSDEVIARRLRDSLADLSHWNEFDYIVVNDDFERATDDLEAIVTGKGEQLRRDRAELRELLAKLLTQVRIYSMKLSTLTLATALFAGAAAYGQQAEQPRTIGVSGQGEVRAEPDRAAVTLGVESRKPKLDDARAEVAKTVDAVLKLTRELKIDPKLVRSTRVNVQPEYNWNPQANERNLIGYYVARQVEVELRDLEKLGQLLERSTDLGVNQLGEPRLDSSKRQDLVREALAKAVVDARQNAEVIAKAAGAKLGTARTINANTDFTPPPMPMVRAMAMEAKAAGGAPYQSGEMTFNATVNVQYDLIAQ